MWSFFEWLKSYSRTISITKERRRTGSLLCLRLGSSCGDEEWFLFSVDQLNVKLLVDCLKITEDKSSDNKVHTSDTRMIRAIGAVSRRRVRSSRLKHHCSIKTQGSRPASQHHCNTKNRTQHLRFNTTVVPERSESNIISMVKCRAQALISTANEPCVSVITALITESSAAHVMRGVNPHYGRFLGDSFTPETPINSSVCY